MRTRGLLDLWPAPRRRGHALACRQQYDGQPRRFSSQGNRPVHLALAAASRDAVDAVFAAAQEHHRFPQG